MTKTDEITKQLAEGKEAKDVAKAVGTSLTYVYRVKNQKNKKATSMTKKKAPAKRMKRKYTKREDMPKAAGNVVWRAANGGSAVFASEQVARAYLGNQAKVIPVSVLS